MKNEIELFYDKNLNEKIGDKIEFEPIKAGETTKKVIYLKNNLKFLIDELKIDIENDDVELENIPTKLKPYSLNELKLIYKPKLTRTTPIKTSIKINGRYIII